MFGNARLILASKAADAGAQFAVSPGLTRVLLNASDQVDMPYLPGVFTPSEVMAARDMGFQTLKLFPAAQCGGIGMLEALASPRYGVITMENHSVIGGLGSAAAEAMADAGAGRRLVRLGLQDTERQA